MILPRQASILICVILFTGATFAAPAPWHTSLCLGDGGVWPMRIPITIRNNTDEAMAGKAMAIAIGKGEGQADLAGASIGSLRVCDPAGSELLFAVRATDGKPIQAGPIPEASTLVIPAECPPKSTSTCYIYFGNDAAWPVPDMLSAPPAGTATAGRVERHAAARTGDGDDWPADVPGHRAAVRVLNESAAPLPTFVAVDARAIRGYLRARQQSASFRIDTGSATLPAAEVGESLFVQAVLPPNALVNWHLYPAPAGPDGDSYQALLASPANLAKNPSFEDASPGAWQAAAKQGVDVGLADGSRFGARCARIHVPANVKPDWVGWRQDVPVEPGASYLFAAWIKCENVAGGAVQLHAHLRTAKGELANANAMLGVGPALTGTAGWSLLGGVFHMPEEARIFQVHLTMNATGTVWHDGVIVARVTPGMTGPIESRMHARSPALSAWPVNPIVKVFRHDLPSEKPAAAQLSAARNEREPLQLAIRSRKPLAGVRVSVDPPKHADGAVLKEVQVAVVGYVPIDYPTNYYQSAVPAWRRRLPTQSPGCDGWSDWWPDPLLPRDTLDLRPEETQAAWIAVSVPKDAPAGDYHGAVILSHEGKPISRVPFNLHVWDFALEDTSHVKAIYDVRIGGRWKVAGRSDDQAWRELVKFMADRRLCPDAVAPAPQLRYENGKVIADFAEFDRAAAWYFDELKLPHAYTPHAFYGFGWGLPPRKAFDQEPYPGQRPFDGADRAALRPEYRQAYQACLRAFWSHLKEKGWDRKVLLYLSDEPFDREPAIREQMKAICAMIREVDPAIPIYSSTWHHVPAWDGSITAWGIGHYGVVPPEKIAQLRAGGARVIFTTDGHMCTDTPYCAIERLLPHYCFKYGVEGYEFWGSTWLTYDPYQYGWHAFIHQSDTPGKSYYIRYPNGDGYLIYPGGPIGHAGPVSSVRLEQAREGVEDYEYLWTLRQRIEVARASGRDVTAATAALEQAMQLVEIPNAGGRYSTRFLPDPAKVLEARAAVARAIQSLR